MFETDRYIRLISTRGNPDGTGGGLLDLLDWCGKCGLREVTPEEARRFWEHPPVAFVDNAAARCGKPMGNPPGRASAAVDYTRVG